MTLSPLLSRLAVVVVTVLAFSFPAYGQLAPGMDGRATQTNYQIGGVTPSFAPPRAYINSGNLLVTGNVSGGRSFQGYSPITDSSSLLLTLPSTNLGNFRRDSVGLGNLSNWAANQAYAQPNPYIGQSQPFYGQALPYFEPSATVANVQAIDSGLNLPGSSVPRTPFTLPNRTLQQYQGASGISTDAFSDVAEPGLMNTLAVPSSSMYTPENLPLLQRLDRDLELSEGPRLSFEMESLRSSPVFTQTIQSTQSILPTMSTDSYGTAIDPYADSGIATLADRRLNPLERSSRVMNSVLRRRVPTSEDMLVSSSELLSPTTIAPRLFDEQYFDSPRDELTGRPLPPPSQFLAMPTDISQIQDPLSGRDLAAQVAGSRNLPIQALLFEPSLGVEAGDFMETAGYAVGEGEGVNPFADLAYAVQWLTEVAEDPEMSEQVETIGTLRDRYDQAVSIVHGASTSSVRSLAGKSKSKVDDLIARAEEKVREGKYYQASTIYNVAASYDSANPMIRLGHAHALLAAGEYMTAVLHLANAIERYPAFGYLNLDLNDFIPDAKALDIRRADLERRLSQREDYRLRFLLGYIEYYTGLAKFGLPNLRKAAATAPAGSPIARFPEMLEADSKLELQTPAAPDPTHPQPSDDGQ